MKHSKRWLKVSLIIVVSLILAAIVFSNRQSEKQGLMPGPIVPMRKLEPINHKKFNSAIELRALARDGTVLLTTSLHPEIELDINGNRAHLIGLSADSIGWVGGFKMPDRKYWSWSGGALLVSPTANKVLFHNQYVDLDTWSSIIALPYISVSGMENVVSEPLDISPNGKATLVRIRSSSGSDLDTTVLYDLESGAIKMMFPQRTNLTGNRQALHRLRNDPTPNSEKNTIQTACFISDDTIALMLLDGKLEILNIATNHREPIPIKILGDAAYRHKARLLPIRNSVYLVSWVYGDNGITVIDWKSKRILWQVDGHVSCPIYQDGKLLYAAESVWKQREGLSEYEKNFAIGCSVLAMREIVTGNLVLEYECERFDSVVLDTKQSFLWALDGKTLYKFHIDLTTPQ